MKWESQNSVGGAIAEPPCLGPSPRLQLLASIIPDFYPVQVCHLNSSYLIENKGRGSVLPGTNSHLFFFASDARRRTGWRFKCSAADFSAASLPGANRAKLIISNRQSRRLEMGLSPFASAKRHFLIDSDSGLILGKSESEAKKQLML